MTGSDHSVRVIGCGALPMVADQALEQCLLARAFYDLSVKDIPALLLLNRIFRND
jgi:hypothetical protein